MPSIPHTKRELRKHYRALRAGLDVEERAHTDAFVAMRVQELDAWKKAQALCTYLSMGSEVDTRTLIRAAWDAGKLVALPRCVPGGRLMRWYLVDSLEGLEKSSFGVEEPAEDPAREFDPQAHPQTLALVPGLVFDARGFRLGYGGGFYDSFLPSFGGVSVGLAREALLVDDLRALGVCEPHDRPVDLVVSEVRVLGPLS